MAPDDTTKPTAEEVITYGSPSSTTPPDLRLLHYNDVYHLDSSSAEPVGGIARFITVVKDYQEGERFKDQPHCLTLFSGDAFNPSLESSITKGSHMVPILNAIKTDVAALGNHDLDFGVTQFNQLMGKCHFPWLVANILDPALGENVPIGNARRTHMLTASNGIKIGVIGLGEREWLETINSLPPDLIYKSARETARELAPKLRAEGADMIVALTHMREPNDNKLAESVGDQIDLILGGHDHYYSHSLINGCHVLRSGTDFKQLSYIEARRPATNGSSQRWDFTIYRRDIVSSIAEHKPTLELAERLTAKLKQSLEKPVGWTAAPLDARFTTVRLKESNIGNFVCDIMRHHYNADCALMAAGTIRGDQIYPPGPIRVKDITDCFPFEDPIVVLKVTGKAIREALENSVSLYPALEGRFPQVSNIRFTFDPKRPSGERVTEVDIAGDGYLPEKLYVLSTRGYMGRGKDGYKSLLIEEEGGQAIVIVSEENGILISMLLRQYFMQLKVLDRWTHLGPHMSQHWDKVVSKVTKSHPVLPPKKPTPNPSPVAKTNRHRHSASSWENWTPAKMRARRSSVGPLTESDTDVDRDTDVPAASPTSLERSLSGISEEQEEKELRIMRRVFGRWCRKAGVNALADDELEEDEVDCDWTQAIAPKVEGRIVMIGS
ncbi:Metallo-dependent phosphatase [Cryphonectria parasitica EP155]|uniref:Metallo-dependent phosphatase n=1 Tax=Cryphonectria parasitica (strain ATCC 38755 / EP155) TaxID=660469 RepID=A0A9P4Y573_CRYP1|nr:Metallo-dependent phosphatase [Cryphonectria parasitica EP155]KAF3766705.1 Metallo-dependent phosphatase [Cryphonectria parasitica EP155]